MSPSLVTLFASFLAAATGEYSFQTPDGQGVVIVREDWGAYNGAGTNDVHLKLLWFRKYQVRAVRFVQSSISDNGIMALLGFRELNSIWFQSCPNVTSGGLATLISWMSGSLLDVTAEFTGSQGWLPSLRRHRDLTVLDCTYARLSAADCATLQSLQKLVCLSIGYGEISPEATDSICRLKSLSNLRLNNVRIRQADADKLNRLPGVDKIIWIDRTGK